MLHETLPSYWGRYVVPLVSGSLVYSDKTTPVERTLRRSYFEHYNQGLGCSSFIDENWCKQSPRNSKNYVGIRFSVQQDRLSSWVLSNLHRALPFSDRQNIGQFLFVPQRPSGLPLSVVRLFSTLYLSFLLRESVVRIEVLFQKIVLSIYNVHLVSKRVLLSNLNILWKESMSKTHRFSFVCWRRFWSR